jgi:hypothetical protein
LQEVSSAIVETMNQEDNWSVEVAHWIGADIQYILQDQ